MKRIRTVLIGYGYWGNNVARNLKLNPNYDFLGIVDSDRKKRIEANNKYQIPVYDSHKSVKDQADLVIIMTRPGSHLELAKYFLNKKSNILLAKPCGVSKKEAQYLSRLARKVDRKVFCDYTYHYSANIKFIKEQKKFEKTINNFNEYVSYRTSLGIIQSDLDVVADLACHDFYILKLLTKSKPIMVSCLNLTNKKSKIVKSVIINLRYATGLSALIHVGWNSPSKVRHLTLVSESSGVIIDENDQRNPIKLINYKTSRNNYLNLSNSDKVKNNISFVKGPIFAPSIPQIEPLALELEEIWKNLNGEPSQLPNIEDSTEIWEIIEACRKSMRKNEESFVKF